jgi:hypothetical protein
VSKKSWKNVVLMAFALMSSYTGSATAGGGDWMGDMGNLLKGDCCDDRARFYIEATGQYIKLNAKNDATLGGHHSLHGNIWGVEAGFEYTCKEMAGTY